MRFGYSIAGIAGAALIAAGIYAVVRRHDDAARRIDFSRDIRPIFNQSCVSCHGGVRQKNGVSFIYREEALGRGKSGRPTIVPGHPERSELIARITTSDPVHLDPKANYHVRLTLTKVIPPLQEPVDTPRVKHVEIQSAPIPLVRTAANRNRYAWDVS